MDAQPRASSHRRWHMALLMPSIGQATSLMHGAACCASVHCHSYLSWAAHTVAEDAMASSRPGVRAHEHHPITPTDRLSWITQASVLDRGPPDTHALAPRVVSSDRSFSLVDRRCPTPAPDSSLAAVGWRHTISPAASFANGAGPVLIGGRPTRRNATT